MRSVANLVALQAQKLLRQVVCRALLASPAMVPLRQALIREPLAQQGQQMLHLHPAWMRLQVLMTHKVPWVLGLAVLAPPLPLEWLSTHEKYQLPPTHSITNRTSIRQSVLPRLMGSPLRRWLLMRRNHRRGLQGRYWC
jgi:hypothetical protein